MKCAQCKNETSARGALVINRSKLLFGVAHVIVAAEKIDAPEHFELAICGKECFMNYMSSEADSMLDIKPVLHEGMEK